MEFQVINRNRNAVIPEGMFKLCGMEDAKLISMVQLNGGILLMPESVSTYQLLMLIDALNEQACEFLEAVAAECGPAEAEHRDMTLDEVLREFTVAVPDWAREKAGITADTKLDCEASEDAGVIAVYPASYRHDLTDVPRSILQCLLASGHSLYALNDILTAESENSDAEYLILQGGLQNETKKNPRNDPRRCVVLIAGSIRVGGKYHSTESYGFPRL